MVAIVLGLTLRVVMLTLPPIVTPDSFARYEPLGHNLAAGHGYSTALAPPYAPDATTQPGYPLFLAGAYLVAGESRRTVVVAQMLVELLVLICIWRLARLIDFPPAAQAAVMTMALLCPVLPVLARAIWSEAVATVMLTATCLAWLTAVRTGG